ncbi:hypothetical protein C0993_003716 [Termitomyces sp. T159_Od127]|nr:hypothetical protein C0993_003716 [Termitomyces sp. T159_Od127]
MGRGLMSTMPPVVTPNKRVGPLKVIGAASIILIPTWVGQVCLLLGNSLTTSEQSSCALMTGRAYNTFQTGINGVSAITGANTLDIASIGIDLGLSTSNMTLVSDAYARVHSELVIKNGIKADGIRADGSFGNLL